MYYCGLDLGKKSSHFCIMNEKRKIVEQGQVRNKIVDLAKRFGDLPPMKIVVEASTKSFCVADRLEEMEHEVVVVDPGRTRAIGAARIKHDKLDAKILAELCVADLLAQVDRPNEQQRLERLVIISRDALVRSRARLVMMIRSILDSEGIELKSCATDAFADAVSKINTPLPPEMKRSIEPALAAIQSLNEQIENCDKQIKEAMSEDKDVKRLLTIPGVGVIVAAHFLVAMRNPKRFESGRQLGAYLGLVPSLYQSGKTFRRGSITKRGNKQARWALCVAANALLRTKRDTAIRRWGLGLVEKLGRKKAIVAIARKLASVMWSMLKNNTDFEARIALAK